MICNGLCGHLCSHIVHLTSVNEIKPAMQHCSSSLSRAVIHCSSLLDSEHEQTLTKSASKSFAGCYLLNQNSCFLLHNFAQSLCWPYCFIKLHLMTGYRLWPAFVICINASFLSSAHWGLFYHFGFIVLCWLLITCLNHLSVVTERCSAGQTSNRAMTMYIVLCGWPFCSILGTW